MKSVVCFGEVIWDILPRGNFLGGAPYNVAYHLAHLDCAPRLVSAVGHDAFGDNALAAAKTAGLDTGSIARLPDLPTGTARVSVDSKGQPVFAITESVAWDNITAVPSNDVRSPDALVYGSLALRSQTNRHTLRAWLKSKSLLRVCDLNLRAPFDHFEELTEFIRSADILKLNRDEARRLVAFSQTNASPAEHAAAIAGRYGCLVVCITLGPDGALLWTKGRTFTAASPDVIVRDTIGAGDAFTAALLAGRLASGDAEPDWKKLLERACALGAFVSSRDGAQPVYTISDVPGLATS